MLRNWSSYALLMELQNNVNVMENNLEISHTKNTPPPKTKQSKTELLDDSAIPFLGIDPKELKAES